jgi:hypothetical protein
MKQLPSLSELDVFAKQCINSQAYPDDNHNFSIYSCNSCKSSTFKVSIEHHTGSTEWDFKGIIHGECAECGYLMPLFTFTGTHRQKLKEEHPECECGGRIFTVGLCERYEGEQGIPGFFDEGVIVGKCSLCTRNQAFVFTD